MLQWNPSYLTGNQMIDLEHQFLFQMSNEIMNSLQKGLTQFRRTYCEFEQYTILHFAGEDRLLSEIGFHDFETHQIRHQHISKEIQLFPKTYYSIFDIKHGLELSLPRWIIGHIEDNMAYKTDLQLWTERHIAIPC